MSVSRSNSKDTPSSFFFRRKSPRRPSSTEKKTTHVTRGRLFRFGRSKKPKNPQRSKSATRPVSDKKPPNLHKRNVTEEKANLGYSPSKLQKRSENSGVGSPKVYIKRKIESKKLSKRKPNAVTSEDLANSAPLTPLTDRDLLTSTHSRDSI